MLRLLPRANPPAVRQEPATLALNIRQAGAPGAFRAVRSRRLGSGVESLQLVPAPDPVGRAQQLLLGCGVRDF